jgi:hypothetical protein
MSQDKSQTTSKDMVMLRRIENAGALLRGADDGLRRADKALRLAIEEAQTAGQIANTARVAFSQVCGDVEYQSWINEAAADAEMKSWGIAA